MRLTILLLAFLVARPSSVGGQLPTWLRSGARPALGPGHGASLSVADTVLWRYAAGGDVAFVRLTPLGSVVVSSFAGLVALDPATGRPIWTRQDIAGLNGGAFDVIPMTPYGVVRSRNGIAILDLQTGATAWDSAAVPLQHVRGFLYVPEHRMLLVYGRGRPDGRALVAMDVDSGKVRWTQRTLLGSEPELWEVDGVHSLSGHQPPLADTDSTLILYINKDGPFKIHVATGALLWRVDGLKGEDPPTLAAMYPPMPLGDSMLLVPYEKKLMAVDPRSGRVVWSRAKNFDSPLSQLQATSRGIMVRGTRPLDDKPQGIGRPDAFLDFVDLRTGTSLWQKPFGGMKNESLAPFLIVGDTVYLGDRDRLFAVALQDGGVRELARYEFEGGEEPVALERRNDDLILLSAHNLLLINTRGVQQLRRYYPAPGTSLLGKLGKGLLFVASAMSQAGAAEHQAQGRGGFYVTFDYNPFIKTRMQGLAQAYEDYTFIYTRAPDRAGREGFSLVRLRKANGEEAGRVWLDDRSPEYELDAAAGTVYAKRGPQEIVALKFVQP
jgi:outer membrane protein assembly factor BamB